MPQRTPVDFYAKFYATSKLNTWWSYAHKIPWWPLSQNVLRIFLSFHPHSAMLWTNFEGIIYEKKNCTAKTSHFLRVLIGRKCLDLNQFSSKGSFSARAKDEEAILPKSKDHNHPSFYFLSSLSTPPSRKNQSVWPVSATEECWGGWIEHNLMRSSCASIWSQQISGR